MTSLPSDEVAEDYKGSLEDLVTNDRYQISNLTLIAKENVEHAEAISRVLINHINRAPPTRKLPALYVLDSIAKNVGSPYTVYFGRNLHQTYMHAYSQVDVNVRRKFEEMLKTWREPVPGSLSSTPVFPISSTQSIVDSLSRFRATTAGASRYQGTPVQGGPVRAAASQQPYRQTPTPPQSLAQYPPGLATHLRSPVPSSASPYPQTTPSSYPAAFPSQASSYYQQSHQHQPPSTEHFPVAVGPGHAPTSARVDVVKLHSEIDDLITDAKIECATHPMNHGAQRQLASLQTLKEILDSGNASDSDLQDIRATITQKMAEKSAAARQSITPASTMPPGYGIAPPQTQQTTTPAAPTSLNSIFNTTNLAELLRVTQQSQSQQPTAPLPGLGSQVQSGVNTPVTNGYGNTAPPTAPLESSFFAQLRASGLLSSVATPVPGTTSQGSTSEARFTSAWVRMSRPHLVHSFLHARPNQCSTCGRRFSSDDIGRDKKAAHLDWHFKTKERMLEAEKRGQNRSWYVDERDWISSKEYEDDGGEANGAPSNGAPIVKKVDFVRAPTDPVLRSLPCPIDQEPFKSEWSEEVQDFIWKDAIFVGGRYYHASCYAEVSKGRERDRDRDGLSTPVPPGTGRTATPDSVLGKRKAAEDMTSAKSKIKFEAGV
ncbi:hypothetical protein B0A52_08973 [Exophiala mesophila]|uniref:CID domain-containing protein n=1 Tax=Exophiala mesophila TaxID=212818 RepID=A0A438MV96_EXOME|nr:hypothetical protein B0A52_08973 [Exophiala mesophila]